MFPDSRAEYRWLVTGANGRACNFSSSCESEVRQGLTHERAPAKPIKTYPVLLGVVEPSQGDCLLAVALSSDPGWTRRMIESFGSKSRATVNPDG